MCSKLEDDSSREEFEKIFHKKRELTCRKCVNDQADIVLQKKFSYCRACFHQNVLHKFRSTIGKLKLKQVNDHVLLVFFGNQSSTALLHLIREGMNETCHKRLLIHLKVLYIDESVLWPKNVEATSTSAGVLNILKQYDFPCYVTKLSSIYEDVTIDELNDVSLSTILMQTEPDDQLKSLFNGIKSSSTKIDLLGLLRYHIWYKCAALLNCNKIFAPECATNVAIGLLCGTILGRSSRIPYDTAVCDKRNPAIDVIRPLREITLKEIAFYNIYNNIELLQIPSPIFMFDCGASLQLETSTFVLGLQEDFPSTVYTVFRIGDKLSKSGSGDGILCPLCLMAISTSKNDIAHLAQNLLSGEVVDNSENKECIKSRQLKCDFCPSCRFIINDMESLQYFPKNIFYTNQFSD